jgi:Pentapeptide repeats (9 copies)
MSPEVEAAIIAGAVGVLTVIVSLYGTRKTSKDTRDGLNKQLTEQREALRQTLAEDRTRTLNERFATAADKLGSDKPAAVRLAGVYAMAGLADDWGENRQTCIDVLCAYLRLPYERASGEEIPAPDQLALQENREVRHTLIRVITAHLRYGAAVSWQGLNFSFNGVVFDGGDFRDAVFSGGFAVFDNAEFFSGTVSFSRAVFSGAEVYFGGAKFTGARIRFEDAEFSGGTVSFRDTEMSSGMVEFTNAKFTGGTVDLSQARFSGCTVDFKGAANWSFPPVFPRWEKPPSSVRLPP